MKKLKTNQEMVSCAKKVKLLASDSNVLTALIIECCLEIINNQTKQKAIINTPEKQEDDEESFILFEQTVKDKLSNKLKNELSYLVRLNLYNEVYQTSASKQGHFDALKLIQSWGSQNIDQPESTESIKQQFINEILQNDTDELAAKNEAISCLNPLRRDCCQLF